MNFLIRVYPCPSVVENFTNGFVEISPAAIAPRPSADQDQARVRRIEQQPREIVPAFEIRRIHFQRATTGCFRLGETPRGRKRDALIKQRLGFRRIFRVPLLGERQHVRPLAPLPQRTRLPGLGRETGCHLQIFPTLRPQDKSILLFAGVFSKSVERATRPFRSATRRPECFDVHNAKRGKTGRVSFAVPSGGSPGGTGRWPVLPKTILKTQKIRLAKFLLISCRRQIISANPHRLRPPTLMKKFSWAP